LWGGRVLKRKIYVQKFAGLTGIHTLRGRGPSGSTPEQKNKIASVYKSYCKESVIKIYKLVSLKRWGKKFSLDLHWENDRQASIFTARKKQAGK
jgi:hypothetical protein